MTSPSLSPGERVGAYEVVSLLGAGGMGEVYRARDTRLDREVAIKVLPASVASDPERLRRFELEARATSALNHPNILVVHDVGTHQGAPYLVSELLEGETLRSRLDGGHLPAKKALEIGVQIASGLAAAHAKGIVHRDLKPENLFVTKDGHVKILDFGLARQTPKAKDVVTGETLTVDVEPGTDPGTVMGTVSYMSPEQVRGEVVDQRSDIFSLGCVLYELASGRRAFKRETAVETMTAILREEPLELGTVSPEQPAGFARAISHCLEKKAEERFQTARDLGYALKAALEDSGDARTSPAAAKVPVARRRWAWAVGIALVIVLASVGAWLGLRQKVEKPSVKLEPKRVVVAVFENQTGDKSLDQIGRIAADWISQGLSRIGEIEVVPTIATLEAEQMVVQAEASRPRKDALSALAEVTEAGIVVSGSYYTHGSALLLQAKVMDASNRDLIYAIEPVSGERESPMKVIEAMRQRVMGVVAAHYSSPFKPQESKPPLFEAYREFTIGMETYGRDYQQSIRHFQKAADIDPSFLPPQLYIVPALEMQGELAKADVFLRHLCENRERATLFERHFLDFLSADLAGHNVESLQALRRAEKLAPRSAAIASLIGERAYVVNQPRLVVETLAGPGFQGRSPDAFLDIPPAFRPSWLGRLADAQHMLGSYDRELEAADQNTRIFPEVLRGRRSKVCALAALGRLDEVQRVIEDSLSQQFHDGTTGDLMQEASTELRAHGHRAAALQMAARAVEWRRGRPPLEQAKETQQQALASALYLAERWDEAREIYEPLSARYPLSSVPDQKGKKSTSDDTPVTLRIRRAIECFGRLGMLAARRGDRPEAERIADELARLDRPFLFGRHTFNRARIAALLGDKERAVALQQEAFAQGYYFSMRIHCDIDLEPLRGYAPFEELIKPKG